MLVIYLSVLSRTTQFNLWCRKLVHSQLKVLQIAFILTYESVLKQYFIWNTFSKNIRTLQRKFPIWNELLISFFIRFLFHHIKSRVRWNEAISTSAINKLIYGWYKHTYKHYGEFTADLPRKGETIEKAARIWISTFRQSFVDK